MQVMPKQAPWTSQEPSKGAVQDPCPGWSRPPSPLDMDCSRLVGPFLSTGIWLWCGSQLGLEQRLIASLSSHSV